MDKSTSNNVKITGETIRRIRLYRDMTLKDLAHECGISQTYLCLIEQGKRNPPESLVSYLSNKMGVDTSLLHLVPQAVDSLLERFSTKDFQDYISEINSGMHGINIDIDILINIWSSNNDSEH